MKYIDLHCDTLMKIQEGRKEGLNLDSESLCVNIPGMKKAETMAQFFACFTYLPDNNGYDGCYEIALDMMNIMKEEAEIHKDAIAQAFSLEDIKKNHEAGLISGVLTVEEGGILNGKMERLETIYEKGVRLVTPLWNFENCLGYPSSDDPELMKKGLKPFGFEAVEYAGELGIILDVSHSSDGTFYDIIQHAKGPVVASHSNCRSLCGHRRNLTDDMIRKLAEKGGIAGVNFYGAFLDGSTESRAETMIQHLKYMIRVGGSDFPAIGTDYDGYDGMTYEDFPNVTAFTSFCDRLSQAGFGTDQIEKIMYRNAERVLAEI